MATILKFLIFYDTMRTINSNLVYVISSIFFCCLSAVGSPPLGAEQTALAIGYNQIPVNLKEKMGPFTIEEIFSPKKYLKKYLEIAKKEVFQRKLPDSEHLPVVAENETPLTVERKDAHRTVSLPDDLHVSVTKEQSHAGEKNGTQTSTVDKIPLQAVTDEKSPLSPDIVEEKDIQEGLSTNGDYRSVVTEDKIPDNKQKMDVHSMPTTSGTEIASDNGQRSLVIEKDANQANTGHDKSLQPLIAAEFTPIEKAEKNAYVEKSLTYDNRQLIPSFSDTFQKTKEEGAPLTVATPEFHNNIIAGGELLPREAKGTHTLGVENISHTMGENGTPLAPGEESTPPVKEGISGVLDGGAKEHERATPLPEIQREVTKKTENLKYTWEIWHTNPTLSVIIAVAITLIAAKIGGWLAGMAMLPEVVGNLIVGILLGNFFFLTGSEFFDFLRTMPFLKMISYFGTLLLLLTAGLHTDIRALLRVGASSFLVSLGGIIAPAGLSLIVSNFLLSDASVNSKIVLAIILCNTSTGLLFAILNELKALNTLEGRIITGATLLTEIIVILTFGIVSGIATKGVVSAMNVLFTVGIAFSFLTIVLTIAIKYGERFGNFLTNKTAESLKISIVMVLSLLFAFISGSIGLHGVIGAFAAGLLLRNVKFKDSDDKEYRNVERFIRPYSMILVPILFVRVGAQVELESILNMEAILLGFAITCAAVIGKLFCGVCPIGKGINRMFIGIGMTMKLEGTLILSGIARDLGLLNDTVFSSIIMVIVLTSTICPSFLKKLFIKEKKRRAENFQILIDEKTNDIFVKFKTKKMQG